MKQTQTIMGMPATIQIADKLVSEAAFAEVFAYFRLVDEQFSTYKAESEISFINRRKLRLSEASRVMQDVFHLCETTKQQTDGYFDISKKEVYDPSGLVKGWAIEQAARILQEKGLQNYYIEVGGDIQMSGSAKDGAGWTVGIRHPFQPDKIVKVLQLSGQGVATSGTYIRGQHVYNPHALDQPIEDIVSLTVVGPNIYEADRFATASFAMGKQGIYFVEKLAGFEGYMIDKDGIATYTTGFEKYELH